MMGKREKENRNDFDDDTRVGHRSSKRKRVILSDSESDNDTEATKNDDFNNGQDANQILQSISAIDGSVKTPKRKFLYPHSVFNISKVEPSFKKTPNGKKIEFDGEMAHSFINSFRADDDDDGDGINESCTYGTRMTIKCKCKADLLNKTPLKTGERNSGSCKSPSMDGCENERFAHLEFSFLHPDNIRDANGRRPGSPEFCPRTLFVPEDFLKTQTPGHRQWWRVKSQYFDTILFFKVGKFYEMYHMDAVIAVQNLNLTYMRGKIAHCGFPEVAYGRFADQLVSRGYKVARVEQTETPSQLEQRNKQEKAKDKVVRREICRITTPGTRTYGVLDGTDERSALETVESTAHYLYAFCEKVLETGLLLYGMCFIDTSVGTFYISQFEDDSSRSCLRTVLAHYQPSQILYERGRISNGTNAVLQNVAGAVFKEALVPRKEFLTSTDALDLLLTKVYLGTNVNEWPLVIREMLSKDSVVPKCSPDYELCFSALGTVLSYLKKCLIDVDMITMRKFERYTPPLNMCFDHKSEHALKMEEWKNKCLILDGISLYNLNIVPPLTGIRKSCVQDSSTSKFSLYNTINKCVTSFGKRLLRQWLCSPTCDIEVLNSRQLAVGWLMETSSQKFCSKVVEVLRKIPDLERLLQKIHTLGLKYRVDEHPDGRAVMFEALRYNKRKICDLLIALDGFELAMKLKNLYDRHKADRMPELLEQCFGNSFPDISPDIKHFKQSFDHEKAKNDGVIVPEKGLDAEYDAAIDEIKECLQNLEAYLLKIRKRIRCQDVNFHTSGRNRYHLEIPESVAKNLDSEYEMSSSRKGYKRMITDELKSLINDLEAAEQRRDEVQGDVMRRVFADFDCRSSKWIGVAQRTALFDVLLSLAHYATSCGLQMCRPRFTCGEGKPFIKIKHCFHPCLALKMCNLRDSSADGTFVPNDVSLGGESANTLLLTGPNMGGKSTLMRQIAVLVVLAQIGSYVPAKEMSLSPVDRVFTRIGQSTFFVELNEASIILRDATQNSLVIVDELGRGTSTHDGTAVAYSVLKSIAENIGCRTVFSTHYHSLCKEVEHVKNIALAHMACVVDNENEKDPTLESVTFLYKLTKGICPKSYGFFAAKVSGIKSEVVRTAFVASKQIDASSRLLARIIAMKAIADKSSIGEVTRMVEAI
uniref:DNA mismatch repair protein n=1 Tax=Syphacia muris TaxID=451379 RepID=A0A0N5AS05_9BILA